MSSHRHTGPFTERTLRVAAMRRNGMLFREIGDAEGISKQHAQNIFARQPRTREERTASAAGPLSTRFGCPACNHPESTVADSRVQLAYIRRRRECLKCGCRFTTHETIVLTEPDPMNGFDPGL